MVNYFPVTRLRNTEGELFWGPDVAPGWPTKSISRRDSVSLLGGGSAAAAAAAEGRSQFSYQMASMQFARSQRREAPLRDWGRARRPVNQLVNLIPRLRRPLLAAPPPPRRPLRLGRRLGRRCRTRPISARQAPLPLPPRPNHVGREARPKVARSHVWGQCGPRRANKRPLVSY